MADHEGDPYLRDVIKDQLQELEHHIERLDRIMSSVTSEIPGELSNSEEAKAFYSAMDALKMRQEDMRMKLIHLHEAQETEAAIQALRHRVTRLKMEREDAVRRLVFSMIEMEILEAVKQDQNKGDFNGKSITYMRRWLIEKLRTKCDVSKEEVTDVSEKLRQKAPEFEAQLYFLLSQLISMIPGSKEDVIHYDEFKSSLKWLVKDSENKIVQAILDLLNAVERQVGKLGRSSQKVEKGGRVDELFDQLLGNIQLVAYLMEQSHCAEPDISSLGDCIQECEAEQKEIESKIEALKTKD
ncbi:hypothetical protein CDL15_Pgr001147 [Punica granatum]|uniref:Uncharacterized protein n=1 Tax=Punica granatum TaxID=22663 RepID=A0A218WKD0_PUNGR|nr:hypothetical protein CDL15_Pgr001147 [Punica granatum]PKI69098.1 hypothetical protein CRG98_010567 [Punica granatum]